MTIQQINGQRGEQIALATVRAAGMTVEATNWRFHYGEIDIIARDGPILVFIEVKHRAYSDYGRPEAKVTRRKQRKIINAAMAYMRDIGYDWEIRFDVISILGDPERSYHVRHTRDAFFPGLNFRG